MLNFRSGSRIFWLAVLLILSLFALLGCSATSQQDVKSVILDATQSEIVTEIQAMSVVGSDFKLGDLIESSLGSATYELLDPATDGKRYVSIKGKVKYRDVDVVATLQYQHVRDDEYSFYTLTFNDIPQDSDVVSDFFEFMIESTKTESDVEAPAIATTEPVIQTEELQGKLLLAKTSNWTYVTGQEIWEGKIHTYQIDLNGDGTNESFKIARDTPNGFKIIAFGSDLAVNLAYEFSNKAFYDEYDDIYEDYSVQLTFVDLDFDGVMECLASIGDGSVTLETLVVRFTNSIDMPYVVVGSIDGQEYMQVEDDNAISAPYGGQGLFMQYRLIDKMLHEFNP